MDQPPRQVVELAVNLDDVTGEIIGQAIDAMLDDGALDCWSAPITMKKNRPGHCLQALVDASDAPRLARRLMELTGSFGVRFFPVDRLIAHRRHETVQTQFGPIRIKVGSLDDQDIIAKVEFDDARDAAGRHHTTPRQVIAAALAAWHRADRSAT